MFALVYKSAVEKLHNGIVLDGAHHSHIDHGADASLPSHVPAVMVVRSKPG